MMTEFLHEEMNHQEIKELTHEQEERYKEILMVLWFVVNSRNFNSHLII